MSIINKLKSSVNSFLSTLAKDNKELFGDGTPDCCKLNQQSNKGKKR